MSERRVSFMMRLVPPNKNFAANLAASLVAWQNAIRDERDCRDWRGGAGQRRISTLFMLPVT